MGRTKQCDTSFTKFQIHKPKYSSNIMRNVLCLQTDRQQTGKLTGRKTDRRTDRQRGKRFIAISTNFGIGDKNQVRKKGEFDHICFFKHE